MGVKKYIGYLLSRPMLCYVILMIIGIATGRLADNLFFMPMAGVLTLLLLVVALLLHRHRHIMPLLLMCAAFMLGTFLLRHSDAHGSSATFTIPGTAKLEQLMDTHRSNISGIYRTYGLADDDYGIVAAMTLGERERVDDELREAYYATGAGHVFALSGMHLAILMGIVTFLLPIALFPRLSLFLQLFLMWGYVLLVGLHPSIVRAALMLSTYGIYRTLSRQGDGPATILFSAALLLLFFPSWLFDAGFQMSFMAVMGIMLLCRTRHWLGSIVMLPIAAQLAVLPLVLYYFGRFSPYFLLTSVILSPAVAVIIMLAVLLLFMASLSSVMPSLTLLTHDVARLLATVVHHTNNLLSWESHLPYASITDAYISLPQAILLYPIIASLCILVRTFLNTQEALHD